MKTKPIYKLVDGMGRVYIPADMRRQAHMESGDIVRLTMKGGGVSVSKVEVVEAGDQSPEAVELFVKGAIKTIPDAFKLELMKELSVLLGEGMEGSRQSE